MWFIYALCSAICAAMTSIFAKVGLQGVQSHLATAIRTIVVLVLAWGMVFLTQSHVGITSLDKKNWIFLILSGCATGISWLCYYRALQLGDISKVVPIDKLSTVLTIVLGCIIFQEQVTLKATIGIILMTSGIFLML